MRSSFEGCSSLYSSHGISEELKDDGVFRDFRNGSALKESEYFKDNPGAYASHFCSASDAVELARFS